MKKTIFLSLLLSLLLIVFTACVTQGPQGEQGTQGEQDTQGLEYYPLPDGTYGVMAGQTQYLSHIEIPSTYEGKAITQILPEAFMESTNLTSITIPDSVTSIGSSAFFRCTSLASVYITDIAKWCGISFGNSSANPLSYAVNLYLNGELVTDLVIPDSVTSIGSYAFSSCDSLTSITIHDAVTSIGESAFSGCSSLTSITIPDSVTSISDGAFSECAGLTSITIPDSVTCIDNSAFNGCSSLTSITFDGTKAEWNAIKLCTDWNGNVPATEVVCSDGVVKLK